MRRRRRSTAGSCSSCPGIPRWAADQYRRAAAPPLFSERAASNLLGIALLSGDRSVLREMVDNVALPIAGLPGNRIPEFLGNLAAALGGLSRTGEAEAMQRSIVARGGATPALRWNMAVLAWRRGDVAAARKLASEIPPAVARLWPVEASRVAWDRDASGVPPLDGSAGFPLPQGCLIISSPSREGRNGITGSSLGGDALHLDGLECLNNRLSRTSLHGILKRSIIGYQKMETSLR